MIALLLGMGAALGQYIALHPIIITVAGVSTKETKNTFLLIPHGPCVFNYFDFVKVIKLQIMIL